MFYVFRFQLFKQIKRGDTIVRANVYGYALTNPVKGIISDVLYGEAYPEPHDFKNELSRECMRIIQANACESKPSLEKEGRGLEVPSLIPADEIQKDVIRWITQNLIFTKSYTVRSGIRKATFTFKTKDFVRCVFMGCFAVPTFHLAYKHLNSSKIFKRNVLGYSGEVIIDEIRCSMTKMPGKTCENFPDNVCPVCGNIFCNEHGKQCEKCGVNLCKNCIMSKGLIFKHYFCPGCSSKTEKFPIPGKQAPPSQPITCPGCNQSLTWILQHGRWYCYNCQRYL